MNHNNEARPRARYWVLQLSEKSQGLVISYELYPDAVKCAEDLTWGNDGHIYAVTDNLHVLTDYCNDYRLTITNYLNA